MALTEATRETLWLINFLEDLNINIDYPIEIFEDNQACINLIQDEANRSSTRHMSIKYHFINEKIKEGKISIRKCSLSDQKAVVFTKSLDCILHNAAVNGLNLK